MNSDEDGNMVEIREFVDATGVETSSEVVKLSDEAKSMKKGEMSQVDAVMEKLQDNLKMGPAQGVEMDVSVFTEPLLSRLPSYFIVLNDHFLLTGKCPIS